MRVLMCDQGTPAWSEARAGLATGSRFGDILTDKTLKLSASATPYACELVAETLIGGPDPWKSEGETIDMRRGHFTEHEARQFIEIVRGIKVVQVGFCIHDNGRWGCSPDGLIGSDEGLELKCPAPKTQIQWLIQGGLPYSHRAQVHGGMIVTGRPRWTFLSYCVGLPPLMVEVERDAYTEKLEAALVEFNGIYETMLAKIVADRDETILASIERKGDQLPDNLKALVPPVLEESYF